MGNIFTTAMVAAITGYRADYIRQLVQFGKIRASKVGRDLFYDRKTVRELLNREGCPNGEHSANGKKKNRRKLQA